MRSTRSRKTVIRAGYGIFYGRYPGGLINTFFLGNGLYQKSISLNPRNASDKAAGPVFPNVLPEHRRLQSAGWIGQPEHRCRRISGLLTRSRPTSPSSANSRATCRSRLVHLEPRPASHVGPGHQYRRCPDRSSPTASTTPAATRPAHTRRPIYVRQNRVDPRYARINIVDSGLNSWYNGLALQLNKRMSHGRSPARVLHLVSRDRQGTGRGRHAQHLRQRRSADLCSRRLPR